MTRRRVHLDVGAVTYIDERQGRPAVQRHVVAVLENVTPCEAQPCPLFFPPGDPRSLAVLELPAGAGVTTGITVGSAVMTRSSASIL